MKHREQEKDSSNETDGVPPHATSERSHTGKGHQAEDLSRDDLLFLLSILEGELQVSWAGAIPAMIEGKESLLMNLVCLMLKKSRAVAHTCVYPKAKH